MEKGGKKQQNNKWWKQDIELKTWGLGGVSLNHSSMVLYLSTKGHEKIYIRKTLKNRKENKITKIIERGRKKSNTGHGGGRPEPQLLPCGPLYV